jgi:ApaG protein
MYRETTEEVQIDVRPQYHAEKSKPEAKQYFFSYLVRVTNLSDAPTQLVSRRWVITDGAGEVHEVEGPGVIGEQPWIEPGKTFEYESFCPLPTPTGNMRGHYRMERKDGKKFDAKIPLFFLRTV